MGAHYLTPEKRHVLETALETSEGRSLRSANYLANHLAEAPLLIFCCGKRYNDAPRAGRPMYGSIYPAVQTLCLAARAYGLGTSITGLHHIFGDEINKLLGVPPEYANKVMVPVGYPRGRWGRPARKPAHAVTFFEHWGNRPTPL